MVRMVQILRRAATAGTVDAASSSPDRYLSSTVAHRDHAPTMPEGLRSLGQTDQSSSIKPPVPGAAARRASAVRMMQPRVMGQVHLAGRKGGTAFLASLRTP
jgi:hypothetical protein